MECYLPCIRFKIRTTQRKHSQPTELDVLFLKYILYKMDSEAACNIESIIKDFGFLEENVLHGILNKLHKHYLLFSDDGNLMLRKKVNKLVENNDLEQLTVKMGERIRDYNVFFDRFTGHLFWESEAKESFNEKQIKKGFILPICFSEFDYDKKISNDHYFNFTNERLHKERKDRNEYFLVETLEKHVMSDMEDTYFPIKIDYDRSDKWVLNSRCLPLHILRKIETKLNSPDLEASNELSKFLDKVKLIPIEEKARKLDDELTKWCDQVIKDANFENYQDGFCLECLENPIVWLKDMMSSNTSVVLDSDIFLKTMDENPDDFYASTASYLYEKKRITVFVTDETIVDEFPFCLADKTWVDKKRQWLKQKPLYELTEDDQIWQLFSYKDMQDFEKDIPKGMVKSYKKAIRREIFFHQVRFMKQTRSLKPLPFSFIIGQNAHDLSVTFLFPDSERSCYWAVVIRGNVINSDTRFILDSLLLGWKDIDPNKQSTPAKVLSETHEESENSEMYDALTKSYIMARSSVDFFDVLNHLLTSSNCDENVRLFIGENTFSKIETSIKAFKARGGMIEIVRKKIRDRRNINTAIIGTRHFIINMPEFTILFSNKDSLDQDFAGIIENII